MPKANLRVTINTSKGGIMYELKALMNEDSIIYHEPDELKTKVTYNYKDNILIRDNLNMHLVYEFNKLRETTGTIEVKEYNKYVKVPIITKKLTKNKKY